MSQPTETESSFNDVDVNEDNVENLINQMEQETDSDAEPTDNAEESQAADAVSGEADAKEEEPPAKDPEPEQPKTQVIKTRDGKHEIPYSVLENERNRSRELQRELDAIKAEKARAPQPDQNAPEQDGQSSDMDDESLEAFREEFGDEAADAELKRRQHYANLEKRQKELERDLQEQKKWREEQEAKAQDKVTSEINEAIDSIPELRGWRENGDPMWDAAVALDNRLKVDPDFAGMSYRERFNTVVQRLTGRKPENSTKTRQSSEELLEQKLKQKEQSARTPSSLSDLPGGQIPDQSTFETLDRLSPAQLEAKFASMTPDQQNEYLSKL